MSTNRFYHNFRLTMLLILIPIGVGAAAIYFALAGPLTAQLARFGSDRLITENWQMAYDQLAKSQQGYEPKGAYYRLKLGQDINWVAQHFSVDSGRLQQLNPGTITYNTTISVSPPQQPFQPLSKTSGSLLSVVITNDEGIWRLSNDFRNPPVNTTIPELAAFLATQGIITKIGDKHYRINQPLSLEDNIRLDITGETVKKLELASSPNFAVTCLCFENAEALIRDTLITSVDPATNKPDTDQSDGRSFIRALKSTRMDILNSTISYLGNGLLEGRLERPILRDGATYGISWRITDDTFGRDIATGWVEGNTFTYNHFGAYSFGASGIMWRNNLFTKNEVYGLDPHDDSNNATIENNRFIENGKHGFIVSKRCNYNVIRNNVSANNGLHGYMLHQDSNFNVLENNVASGNTDNFVIYASNFNTMKHNKSYSPLKSHVRVDALARQNFIQDNLFYSGQLGVYLEGIDSLLIERNVFYKVIYILNTKRSGRVLFVNNQIDRLSYKISDNDRVVFGPNQIQTKPPADSDSLDQVR